MNVRFLAVAAAALMLPAADAPNDAAKKDLDNLQGKWVVESRLSSGKEAKTSDETVTFDGDNMVIKIGNHEERGTCKVDPSKKPPTIDMVSAEGKGALLGIYQLDGDVLKIAYRSADDGRPTEFTSSADSFVTLVKMKREKK